MLLKRIYKTKDFERIIWGQRDIVKFSFMHKKVHHVLTIVMTELTDFVTSYLIFGDGIFANSVTPLL